MVGSSTLPTTKTRKAIFKLNSLYRFQPSLVCEERPHLLQPANLSIQFSLNLSYTIYLS